MDIVLHPHHAYATTYLNNVVIHSFIWQDHLYKLALAIKWAVEELRYYLTG